MSQAKNNFASKIKKSDCGFTLVELLVVVVMLVILVAIVFIALNPLSQLDKAKDAQRKQDFTQIRNALDTYYNDNNCYPASVPFGSSWVVGSTVFMQKVPQDPDCSKTGSCYVYQTDGSSCSQWNVLYAHLLAKLSTSDLQKSCPLYSACGILFPKYNYCIFSGNLNCSYIKSNPMPTPAPGGGGTPTPTPTSIPGGACSCATAQYDIRAGKCNLVSGPPFNYCDSNCLTPCQ